ncbi:palmitoyltransferase ZDHHC4 isoform X1 [Latimeria chalumnae]|uniref:palmitoyltransferase ZDHHC4 isoform X1 n=1 Tax=Latimeria chalumnae TaxID=7897 RepID=UPI0003C1628E|nr:PREDICTED: probable palmitoyltransferase ZDHHC4 isoform X2 [Latimeria chalumnae]XP_005994824.1 PREDICTED: probable palmitoyltransferase ZDHHC4 isoform X2 [Latimeria chalumnae]XP_005994825.1 PREDICTED: probable palmitoyltransferase ZDHHC4 isoform X2 [Latimeria chalumnae]XP_005994826.1 PREDICTED: probable palmitoyltransferase ZDHHC4 isoform X2 [Latimeria chalumnae]XP_014343131.1 PREDICTED: probable palmitoyltransferase ZDHHC4 isoform X2 [Latimeria chalumnae]XP_014343132.1 PREDICTED: probable |eukprot:XP_005994822.1 PREDICTED: probable palmitoyltransferase ZDHHC4 isoform X2 [Latimeria chalumnae]
MDFLTLFLIYSVLVLTSIVLIIKYPGQDESFLRRVFNSLTKAPQFLLVFWQVSFHPTIISPVIPLWLQTATHHFLHKLFHTRNAIFLILHFVLEAAVYGEYTWEVFQYCRELGFSLPSLLVPYFLLAVKSYFFYLCCITDPGTITKLNHESLLQVYMYDEVLYQKFIVCPTCNLRKPARSKHCRVCNRCVHRFDHHCVWVNNCIGALNTRYFLIYLITLSAMAVNIAALTLSLLIQVVVMSNMMQGSYIDADGQQRAVELTFVIQHLFLTFPRIVFMLGFLIVLFLLLGGYSCFHVYLILINQTSNEWYKSRSYSYQQSMQCQQFSEGYRHAPHKKNTYSKGLLKNILEIIKPLAGEEKNKKDD